MLVLNSSLRSVRTVDPVQQASQEEDIRSMQWYDNALAPGFWSYSRYARKQHQILEAYIREVGRILSERITDNPGVIAAISGDGESELAGLVRDGEAGGPYIADYSPFAIAEFRDWLRGTGLYADGQPFAGQQYVNAARYRNDPSPDTDGNGDGHTLKTD